MSLNGYWRRRRLAKLAQRNRRMLEYILGIQSEDGHIYLNNINADAESIVNKYHQFKNEVTYEPQELLETKPEADSN